MPKKQTVYIKVSGTEIVKLKVRAGVFTDTLLTKMGYLKPAAGGKLPDNYSLVGSGKGDAVENGAVLVNVVYSKDADTEQTTKVLFSPDNLTAGFLSEFAGEKYDEKDIVFARMPRRRAYVY
jgi:hypothetical protein